MFNLIGGLCEELLPMSVFLGLPMFPFLPSLSRHRVRLIGGFCIDILEPFGNCLLLCT
jgi:hypothetical protein